MAKISRILFSTNFCDENLLFNTLNNSKILKECKNCLIKPIGVLFAQCLDNVIDSNETINLLKQSFYEMISEFKNKPNFILQLQEIIGK